MGTEAVEILFENGFSKVCNDTDPNINGNLQDCCWFEEVIDDDLKWSFALNRFLHKTTLFS